MNDAMSLHSQVMGNYVRLKASKSAIRGHLTKQIICRKITLKSDSDHGYLMLTDTDSIDAFLLSKLFDLIFALSKLNRIFFSISNLWFHVLDILIYKKLCI